MQPAFYLIEVNRRLIFINLRKAGGIMSRMLVSKGLCLTAALAAAMFFLSDAHVVFARANEPLAATTELKSGDGAAIVRDLERRGTPRGNYKISEADDDVVIDAEAYTEGPS